MMNAVLLKFVAIQENIPTLLVAEFLEYLRITNVFKVTSSNFAYLSSWGYIAEVYRPPFGIIIVTLIYTGNKQQV